MVLLALAGCTVAPPAVLQPLPSAGASRPSIADAATAGATARPTASATATPTVTLTATATGAPTGAASSTSTPGGPTPEPTALTPLPTPVLPMLDEAGRAAMFDKVWSAVADHYLYADFRGVDWNAIKAEFRPRALAADTPEAFYLTLDEMIGTLNDQHSRFENPQDAFVQQALASGTDAYVGIGILTIPLNDGLLVTTVFPNGPAANAQIKRRDMIVAVDGAAIDAADPGISGPVNTFVDLTVRDPDGIERVVTLRRQAVLAQYVPEAYLLPGTRIGYVLIQSFWAQDMADKTGAALSQMLDGAPDGIDGLVIDLRSNGGGWRSVLEGLLGNFVQGEVGAWWSQARSYPLTITATPVYDRLKDVPLIVLVDRETESYAEVFAAVLQAQNRAAIVGVNTAGNTETIFAYDFDDGSRLWVAQESFKLPDGSSLEGRGVAPDRTISVDWTQFSEQRDPQIIKAVELIRQARAGSR